MRTEGGGEAELKEGKGLSLYLSSESKKTSAVLTSPMCLGRYLPSPKPPVPQKGFSELELLGIWGNVKGQ